MTKPAKGKTLSFLAAAAALTAALPCAAAYVRGELVWECGFAPDEAERVGVAGLRFDEAGRGADYDPRGGAGGANTIRWSYPGYINGVWWDKEQLRVALKPWIEFQRAHPDAPILVGEFSCILWSKGADQWIRDCIELFEEYGWSWCYHAYREWPAWDVEYTHDPDWSIGAWVKAESDTARKRALLGGLRHE